MHSFPQLTRSNSVFKMASTSYRGSLSRNRALEPLKQSSLIFYFSWKSSVIHSLIQQIFNCLSKLDTGNTMRNKTDSWHHWIQSSQGDRQWMNNLNGYEFYVIVNTECHGNVYRGVSLIWEKLLWGNDLELRAKEHIGISWVKMTTEMGRMDKITGKGSVCLQALKQQRARLFEESK